MQQKNVQEERNNHMRQIRRCVIGTGTDGQSYTQFDHDAPIGMTLGQTGAVGLLWKTSEMPVNNTGDEDQANVPFQPMPGPSETVFVFSIFPPESEIGSEALAQDMKAAGGTQYEGNFANRERHPGMHKTNTLDYSIILEGEIWLLTDTDEVLLKAGDTVVCRGANHHWQNRATVPCTSIFVIINAQALEIP
jgi:hypothetical protein